MDTVLGRFDEKLLWDADRVVVSPGVPLESHGLLALLQSVGHCSKAYNVYITYVCLYCLLFNVVLIKFYELIMF